MLHGKLLQYMSVFKNRKRDAQINGMWKIYPF